MTSLPGDEKAHTDRQKAAAVNTVTMKAGTMKDSK